MFDYILKIDLAFEVIETLIILVIRLLTSRSVFLPSLKFLFLKKLSNLKQEAKRIWNKIATDFRHRLQVKSSLKRICRDFYLLLSCILCLLFLLSFSLIFSNICSHLLFKSVLQRIISWLSNIDYNFII